MCRLLRRIIRMTKQTPGRIEKLLETDERNTRVTPKLMALLHPWAVEAFEDTATLYRLLYRAVGDWEAEHAVERRLQELAQQHALTNDQLIERLKAGKAGDISGAEALWTRLWTLKLVKFMVMACQRYWSYGAAELFRLRHTAALGYLRLEVEAMAFVELFLNDDALAARWSEIRTKKDGRDFFNGAQQRLKETLAKYYLANIYDMASGSAQHVRMASLVRALTSKPGELGLKDQEFDPDDPYSFHLGVAHFHRIQARIIPALGAVLPNVRTDEWAKQELAFVHHAAQLWAILETRYGNQIAEEASDEAHS
jgi:hypothetical protein